MFPWICKSVNLVSIKIKPVEDVSNYLVNTNGCVATTGYNLICMDMYIIVQYCAYIHTYVRMYHTYYVQVYYARKCLNKLFGFKLQLHGKSLVHITLDSHELALTVRIQCE